MARVSCLSNACPGKQKMWLGAAAALLLALLLTAPSIHAAESKHRIRGELGLVSGLSYVGNPAFILGGEYARNILPGLNVVGGLLRWSNAYSDPAFSIDFAMTVIDGGVEYALPLTTELSFKALGRAGVALASYSSEESILGTTEKKDDSTTAFALTFGGGAAWRSGNMEFGGEIRKPLFLAKMVECGSCSYLIGTVGFDL